MKVRGGEVLGEFQTLVNPGGAIPPFIAVLTGITDAMVAGAPDLDRRCRPSWSSAAAPCWSPTTRPFDLGFLRGGLRAARAAVAGATTRVDTARLARRVLTRDEAPNCKLATLARLFRADDRARATGRWPTPGPPSTCCTGCIARLGGLGVHSLEELRTFSGQVSPRSAASATSPTRCRACPGVYLFRDAQDRVLYVGKSVDLRSRVRQYFTASETPHPDGRDGRRAPSGSTRSSARTPLEAEVRELRLIAEHRPRYNRRSTLPRAGACGSSSRSRRSRGCRWCARSLDDGAAYLGPFGRTRDRRAGASPRSTRRCRCASAPAG